MRNEKNSNNEKDKKRKKAGEESVNAEVCDISVSFTFLWLSFGFKFKVGFGFGAVAKFRQYTGGHDRETDVSGVSREKEQRVTWTQWGSVEEEGALPSSAPGPQVAGSRLHQRQEIVVRGGKEGGSIGGEKMETWRTQEHWPLCSVTFFSVFTLLRQLRRTLRDQLPTRGLALFLKSHQLVHHGVANMPRWVSAFLSLKQQTVILSSTTIWYLFPRCPARQLPIRSAICFR